ncbi:MAG: invasin domain 3-containing protein [Pseudomonadota bacterium]
MQANWKLMIKGLFILICFLSVEMHVPCALMAFPGNNMSLSADPTSIQADGLSTTKIKAVVDHNGILLTGVTLTFTTDKGFFQDPTTGLHDQKIIITYSNASGVSEVVLYSATTPGTATITCVASGTGFYMETNPTPPPATIPISVPFDATRSVYVYFTVPAPSGSTVLSADKLSVIADNVSISTITAKLYDQYGVQIARPGFTVTFTITSGAGRFEDNSSRIPVSTDASGTASARVHSDSAGPVGIQAVSSVTPMSAIIYVNFTEPVPTPTPVPTPQPTPAPYLYSFLLSVNPNSVPVADLKPSTITATLFDQYGKKFDSPGISVILTTDFGNFSNNQKTITVSTGNSGVSSAATEYLYSSVVGTAAVNAIINNGLNNLKTNPVFVNFIGPGATASIVLTANPMSNIPADNISFSTITATSYDIYGRTVSSGTKVTFKTNLGRFTNNDMSIDADTDSKGVATAFISSGSNGIAQISAGSNGVARYVNISFTGGVGPPAFISLSAVPYRIPADGSYTTITAVILDSSAQPVAAGTVVRFSTTLGVFQNGKQTYVVATPDATGKITLYLRATSTSATGFGVITCTSGSATQSLTVQFARLELETEPNNSMASADGICFGDVYLGQLFSPYDEDWYTFTITEPSRIGINFITTARPADAGCESGTTTVGTWKADIRNLDNDILMSYHNIDCIYDNGIWETGVIPIGTYYVVVYCPRLGSGDVYLSDRYYMSVFNDFYFPCGDRDKLVNSASLSQEASTYQLHLPIIDTTPYIWADLQYDPIPGTNLMFRLKDSGVPAILDGYKTCNLSNLSLVDGNYVLQIPVVILDGVNYRVDLTYVPTTDGQIWFMLSGIWLN